MGRRRLSGDQVYSRLVKSTVFVMTSDSWGSGSLIHRDRKLVLTNYHVVGDNSQVSVSFPRYDGSGKLIVAGEYYLRGFKNGEFIRGKVLKVAKGQDLALVQLDKLPEGTPVLKLSARSASPGQTVHSVGNPGASDARWSYTSGTVRQVSHKVWKAKLERTILTFDADVVETQSPTNPGDSGGPLVNDQLELVAVTQGANVTAREVSLFIDIAEVKKLLQSCDVRLEDVVAAPGDAPEGGGVDASDVLALGKRLQDKDAATRAEAARRLSECGADARPAARALMKALHDDDPLVRQNAATALGKLGPDAQDLVRKDVFAALQDADAGVRTAALQALADLGPPEQDELPTLLPVLREAIKRKKLKVCLHVARSLARLGANAKDAVPELRLLLKADDREVRLQTLSTLRKIGPAARSADADVAECLQSEDRSVRMQAALALAAIDPKMRGAGKEGLSVLILALKPGSPAEVDDAQAKERVKEIDAQLVKVGEPAAERLLSAIKNEFRGGRVRSEDGALNGQARLAALKIIAEIGPEAYSTSMLSALADLQRTDPYPGVREAARQAYTKIQNKN